MRLAGKVAVITGGAGGIGRATGQLFAAEGAAVLLVDQAETPLRAAVAAIGGEGVSGVVADVTDAAATRHYLQTAVERYGGVDILFANAGIEGAITTIADYPDEAFDQVMAVNVRGVWLGIKYVIPEMRRRGGGSIIITSSIAGLVGSSMIPAYSVSKHAVVGLMRSAALALASDAIRVNTINPGPTDTRMMRALDEGRSPGDPVAGRAASVARIPLGRYGLPEEVARLVLFLASDESSYCTGGTYLIDGARTAG